MPKSRLNLGWFITVFVVAMSITLWTSPISKAYACTQPVGGHIRYSLEERVDQSQIVAEGHVIEVYAESYERIALIEITNYYKGSGPALISVAGYGDGALCRSYITAGQHQIFFLRQNADGSVWASYGSVGDAYTSATEEGRTAIIRHTGLEPQAPSPDMEPNLLNLTLAQSQATSIAAQRQTAVTLRSQTRSTPTDTPTPTINAQTATVFKGTFDAQFIIWRTEQARPLDASATATWSVEQQQYFANGTAFARDFATSRAREEWLTTTPTPRFNTDDVYGPGGATGFPPVISPTTPPARTRTPSSTVFIIPLEGSTSSILSVDEFETILPLSHTPTPFPLPSTDAAVNRAITVSPSPSMVQSESLVQDTDSASNEPDNGKALMFILGFLAATALFLMLGIGYWIGRLSPTNPRGEV